MKDTKIYVSRFLNGYFGSIRRIFMNRFFRLVISLCIAAIFSLASYGQDSAPDIQSALKQASVQFSASLKKDSAAILGVSSGTKDFDEYILDELHTYLMAQGVNTVSRVKVRTVSATISDLSSPTIDEIQQAGKVSDAKIVIYGSFKKLGTSYMLTLQAVSADNGDMKDMFRTSVKEDDMLLALLGNSSSTRTAGQKKDTGRWVGLRGSLGLGIGNQLNGVVVDLSKNVSFGGAIFANFPFSKSKVGIQPELNLYNNLLGGNKVSQSGEKSTTEKGSYLSLDIPLLITYTVKSGIMRFVPEVGPYFSFPLGEYKFGGDSTQDDTAIATIPIFGVAFGIEWTVQAGAGSIVADARYLSDITTLGVKDSNSYWNVSKRGSLNFSLGYLIDL